MHDNWDHLISPNTLAAINKAGLREFYDKYRLSDKAKAFEDYSTLRKEIILMFAELRKEIEANRSVVQSTLLLISDLTEKMKTCLHNPDELALLIKDLSAQRESLAAAVLANTISTPTPVSPTPTPTPAQLDLPIVNPDAPTPIDSPTPDAPQG